VTRAYHHDMKPHLYAFTALAIVPLVAVAADQTATEQAADTAPLPVWYDGDREGDEAAEARRLTDVLEKLREPVTIQFRNAPLSVVLKRLSETTGVAMFEDPDPPVGEVNETPLDWRVTATFEKTPADRVLDRIADIYADGSPRVLNFRRCAKGVAVCEHFAGSFGLMGQGGVWDAYRILLDTDTIVSSHIGPGASHSREFGAFERVHRSPHAEAIYESLLLHAKPAGRFYAIAGLQHLDPKRSATAATAFNREVMSVHTHVGCLVNSWDVGPDDFDIARELKWYVKGVAREGRSGD